MTIGKFVAYYRVSTTRQGLSGLGLEAQRRAVSDYLGADAWELVGEFTEVESAKGADALARRPELRAALSLCKKKRATLIIAKLDRLARNVNFVTSLMEAGIDFKAADMPHADKVMLQMYAVMGEWERDQISKRTKVRAFQPAAIARSREFDRAVVVAVIAVRMVQVAVDEIVDVIPMWDRLMAAPRSVNVGRVVAAAARRALVRIFGAHFELVLVYVIAVRMMQMTVMQIVNVIVVLDRSVSTVRAMLMVVVSVMWFVAGAHV
ncbi:recombinase family protein [Paraburkholderia sediminicola]|uniref:recombinase family protein n=1 Tax=Paraburkholderia sediminicola TaxID=458836 RepID=UPI0038B7F128